MATIPTGQVWWSCVLISFVLLFKQMSTVSTERFDVTSTEAPRFGFFLVLKYHRLIVNIMPESISSIDENSL
jgi:hypothetical protein